jgi:hypothetical protein
MKPTALSTFKHLRRPVTSLSTRADQRACRSTFLPTLALR